jgi:hypothetical protein
MTTATISTPGEKYLEAVQRGLADLSDEDVEEVLQDLAAHIAELGDTDPVTALGTPENFVAEFRHSAGLDDDAKHSSRVRRWVRSRLDELVRARRRMARTLDPLLAPIAHRRDELRTVWIWSRGALAVAGFSWLSRGSSYGTQTFFGSAGLVATTTAMIAVTAVSVWLAGQRRRRWRWVDSLVTLIAVALVLVAVATQHYLPYPDQDYYGQPEASNPVLLIGPNGPIQNLYAYDTAGNPVQVLLYDEYGNPILTLPGWAYDEAATDGRTGEPFIWEGYELRFPTDAYGRPIGNLYPLSRYEWTDTGARSAPQPPPVVGIPDIPAADAGNNEEPSTTTAAPATTTEPPAATSTQRRLPERY